MKIADADVVDTWRDTTSGKRQNASPPPDLSAMRENILTDLLKRLNAKARKERVQFPKPTCEYVYYNSPAFTVYAHVLGQTGPNTMRVNAYSVMTGASGETGEIYMASIEGWLTRDQFDECRRRGWPEQLPDFQLE